MNRHRMPRIAWAVLGLALAAMLALAGCKGSSSANTAAGSSAPAASHSAIPTTSAEAADIAKGRALIEGCVPNGQAMIGGVLHGTASGLTYLQVAKYFFLQHGISKTWDCIATKPGPVPAPAMKHDLENCAASKVTPIIEADHHVIHDRKTITPAVLNAMAECAGKYAP